MLLSTFLTFQNIIPQVNFIWKVTFDTSYNNGFLIRICSKTYYISSDSGKVYSQSRMTPKINKAYY